MDRPRVRQVPGGSGEQRKIEETGYEVICAAQTTLGVKGLMMMMSRVVEGQGCGGRCLPQRPLLKISSVLFPELYF